MDLNKYFKKLDLYQGYKPIKNYGVDKKENVQSKKNTILQTLDIYETNKPLYICGVYIEDDDNVFQEAINHSRNNNKLKSIINTHFDNIYKYKNKPFDQIYTHVKNIIDNYKYIGALTIYDISSCICRKLKINIDRIYIVGNGPKRAIKLLKLKTNRDKTLKLNYVEIRDVKNKFKDTNVKLPNSNNGDEFESWLCVWQKKL
tara:strand:+ start:129 stop:734 length:606 start_codon:yes stop_codon:yes gene_type:complete